MQPQPLKWSVLRSLNKPDREKAIKALREFKPGFGHRSAQFAIDALGQIWAKNQTAGIQPVRIDKINWRVEQAVTAAKAAQTAQTPVLTPKPKGRPRKSRKDVN